MLIVKLRGGLGNQMFQYAFYKALSKKFANVKIDIEKYSEKIIPHNGYELQSIFGLTPDVCTQKERSRLIGSLLRRKIYNKFYGTRIINSKKRNYFFEKSAYQYDASVFTITGNCYVLGYWQSEKYFHSIRDEILNEFTFPSFKESKNIELLKILEQNNCVSIHFRRTDYLNIPLYLDINSIDFYNAAIQYVTSIIENPTFIIFSDDIEWVKRNMDFKSKIFIVDWNTGHSSYKDMQLMSLCRHNIIPFSTFSWWGAWLNQNPKKIIIAPKTINQKLGPDFIPDTWIQL